MTVEEWEGQERVPESEDTGKKGKRESDIIIF